MSKQYKFDIQHYGEFNAGIMAYNDVITIMVESGSPGGDSGDFEEYMRSALAEWFDGATVLPYEEAQKHYKEMEKYI